MQYRLEQNVLGSADPFVEEGARHDCLTSRSDQFQISEKADRLKWEWLEKM